jgi:hypothetical protein
MLHFFFVCFISNTNCVSNTLIALIYSSTLTQNLFYDATTNEQSWTQVHRHLSILMSSDLWYRSVVSLCAFGQFLPWFHAPRNGSYDTPHCNCSPAITIQRRLLHSSLDTERTSSTLAIVDHTNQELEVVIPFLFSNLTATSFTNPWRIWDCRA